MLDQQYDSFIEQNNENKLNLWLHFHIGVNFDHCKPNPNKYYETKFLFCFLTLTPPDNKIENAGEFIR